MFGTKKDKQSLTKTSISLLPTSNLLSLRHLVMLLGGKEEIKESKEWRVEREDGCESEASLRWYGSEQVLSSLKNYQVL